MLTFRPYKITGLDIERLNGNVVRKIFASQVLEDQLCLKCGAAKWSRFYLRHAAPPQLPNNNVRSNQPLHINNFRHLVTPFLNLWCITSPKFMHFDTTLTLQKSHGSNKITIVPKLQVFTVQLSLPPKSEAIYVQVLIKWQSCHFSFFSQSVYC